MFADSIRASSLNRLHKQAGQKTAPDQRHCVNFALATREPSTEDIRTVWLGQRQETRRLPVGRRILHVSANIAWPWGWDL